jgi:hypothetical protein
MLTILRDMLKIYIKAQECATNNLTVQTLPEGGGFLLRSGAALRHP